MKLATYIYNCTAIVALGFFSWGCNSSVVEEVRDFPAQTWQLSDTVMFKVDVPTNQAHDVFLIVKSTTDYPFANLFTKLWIMDGNGVAIESALHEMLLNDPVTGKPMGTGIGENKTTEVQAYKGIIFKNEGPYTVKLVQYMRKDELIGLEAIGLRVALR